MARRTRRRNAAKEQFWRAAIDGQKRSRQSVRDYCFDRDLPEASFYHWRRELQLRGQERGGGQARVPRRCGRVTSAADFVPVRVIAKPDGERGPADTEPGSPPAPIEIILASGHRVRVPRGFERQTLIEVISALESRGC